MSVHRGCEILTPTFQVQPGKKGTEKGGTAEGVEVTLNPEELDLDTAAMQAKYDETMREQQSQLEKEDLSDMVAAHAAKQRVSGGLLFVRLCSSWRCCYWCDHECISQTDSLLEFRSTSRRRCM